MAPGEIHNTDNAETSNAHAAVIARRCEPFRKKFEELETKFDNDAKKERKAPTISRYPLYSHQTSPEIKPRLVSIGPFFHGEKDLEKMQGIKDELMFDLLSRKHASLLLPKLMEKITELQEKAKQCYSGNIKLGDDAFAQMLLVDSCFIIRFLISLISQETHASLLSLDWNNKEIRSDLLLMGNQIPLFVVHNVYIIIQKSSEERKLPKDFNEIVGQFMRMDISWGVSHNALSSCRIADHLLDLYWLCFMPDETELEERLQQRVNAPLRGDGYIYTPVGATRSIPSATELNRVAGVIFKQDKSSSIELHRGDGVILKQDKSSSIELHRPDGVKFEQDKSNSIELHRPDGVKFKQHKPNSIAKFHNGIFEMSSLKVDENMKIILTNLLGYEKNFPLRKRKVSSYILLMDSLINTEEDVALLQESGIIVNALATNLSAAIFFNDIGNMCTVDYANHRFAKLFDDVQKHYESKLKRTLASLRRDYCNSAWARISVAAAIILLLLTVAQTILGSVQTQYTIHPKH
ncbi:hypothetical protein LUZ60_013831 [Juncus effusus]|nr:hypothetical protein LUZ60_013831 [Juncus effusus]